MGAPPSEGDSRYDNRNEEWTSERFNRRPDKSESSMAIEEESRQDVYPASNHPSAFAVGSDDPRPPAFAAAEGSESHSSAFGESRPPAFAAGGETRTRAFAAGGNETRTPAFAAGSDSRPPAFAAGVDDAEKGAEKVKSSGHPDDGNQHGFSSSEDDISLGRPGGQGQDFSRSEHQSGHSGEGRPDFREHHLGHPGDRGQPEFSEHHSGHPDHDFSGQHSGRSSDQDRPNYRDYQDDAYTGQHGIERGRPDFRPQEVFSSGHRDNDGWDRPYSEHEASCQRPQEDYHYTDFRRPQDNQFADNRNLRDGPGHPDFRFSERPGIRDSPHLDHQFYRDDPHLGRPGFRDGPEHPPNFGFQRDDHYTVHSDYRCYNDNPHLGRPDDMGGPNYRPQLSSPNAWGDRGRDGPDRGGYNDGGGGGGRYGDEVRKDWRDDRRYGAQERPYLLGK